MLYTQIEETIDNLNTSSISDERKTILHELIDFIQSKISENKQVNLNFICTHNSRRSHLSQVWAQTLSSYYKIDLATCYSGGTEATAVFPTTIEALKLSGFEVEKLSEESNPVYAIKYANNLHPIVGFSKKYSSFFNPKNEYAAILTCSQADQDCPIVLGAEKRIPLSFNDPKLFDGTPQQLEKYLERSLQIAAELKYVFQKIKS